MDRTSISWINYLKSAALAASSVAGDNAASNLVVDHLSTRWRSGPGTAAYITADLGSVKPCRLFSVHGCNQSSTGTWRIRLSSSAAHAGDLHDTGDTATGAVVVNNVLDRDISQAVYLLPSAINARFVKIDLSDASLATGENFVEVGAAWVGDAWQPAFERSWGAMDGLRDEKQPNYSEGGQKYGVEYERPRIHQWSFDNLTDAERYNQIAQIDLRAGRLHNMLVVPLAPDGYRNHDAIFGTLTALGGTTRRQVNLRSRRFEIEERL